MISAESKPARGPLTRLSPALAALLALALSASSGMAVAAGGQAAKPKLAAVEPGAKQFEELDPKNFDRSENITHPWWPLTPGTQWAYDGYTVEDGQKKPHRIVFTVTDLMKVIGGVRARVIFDTDISEGKMVEQELTYFAQDKVGNVWHLGQYRETFDDDFVGGQIWHVDNPPGAKAGIMMPADPQADTPSYSEGYAPAPFNWTDRGRVYKTGQKTKVRAGTYDDVLIIEEFDATHPGAFQLKYYARGVGNVRVGWRGDSQFGTETLELTKVHVLDEQALAAVRAKAQELEKRASMFPAEPPMEQTVVTK